MDAGLRRGLSPQRWCPMHRFRAPCPCTADMCFGTQHERDLTFVPTKDRQWHVWHVCPTPCPFCLAWLAGSLYSPLNGAPFTKYRSLPPYLLLCLHIGRTRFSASGHVVVLPSSLYALAPRALNVLCTPNHHMLGRLGVMLEHAIYL